MNRYQIVIRKRSHWEALQEFVTAYARKTAGQLAAHNHPGRWVRVVPVPIMEQQEELETLGTLITH